MPLYHVMTLDTFKNHYLVDAKTPEDAEVLVTDSEVCCDAWIQHHCGEFVTKIEEVLIDDPAILALHETQYGKYASRCPLTNYVISEETHVSSEESKMLMVAQDIAASYQDVLATLANEDAEPKQLVLPFS